MASKLRPEFLAGHASIVLINVHEVGSMFGVSSHTIWRRVKQIKGFPQPIKMGKKCTRWNRATVQEYINVAVAASSPVASVHAQL